jgi:hypothetical protein
MVNCVKKICEYCGQEYSALFKQRNKRKFCGRACVVLHQTGEGNPSFGKTYNTKMGNPEWAKKIKKGTKGKINIGSKNAMKRPEVREKMKKSRRQWLSDPLVRQKMSETARKAWVDGKYDGVKVGQCKWFNNIRPDGSVVKLQGTWELAFAKWLDEQNIEYDTHKGRIGYNYTDGILRSYYPDFFVKTWDSFVEIKNDYHLKLQELKFQAIYLCNPNLKLKILRKCDLDELGIKFN